MSQEMVDLFLIGLSVAAFIAALIGLIRTRGDDFSEKITFPWEKEEKRAAKKAAREKERARRELWGVSR